MSKRPFLRRGPSGPLANRLGLIQAGWDQPEKTQPLPLTPPTPSSTLPRDIAFNPIQVQLPGVVPGNVLEVDYNVQLLNFSDDTLIQVLIIAIVSFNGVTLAVSGSGDFFLIDNTESSNIIGFPPSNPIAHFRGLAAVEIPAGATTATIQLLYLVDQDLLAVLGGTDIGFVPGSTLKATEYGSDSVPQNGPTVLVPF